MDVCATDATVGDFNFDVGFGEGFSFEGGECQRAGGVAGNPAMKCFGW